MSNSDQSPIDPDQEKIKKLLAPKPGLSKILEQTRVVEDVLSASIKEPSRLGKVRIGADAATLGATGVNMPLPHIAAAQDRGIPTDVWGMGTREYPESPYLPKNTQEHPDEYAKRLKLTPLLLETPNIMQSRMGSMFKKPPVVELPEGMEDFAESCTARNASLNDVFARTLDRTQVNGYFGILLDREVLPADTVGREDQINQAEADERKLGKSIFAMYTAWQILDWEEDRDGLVWVKVVDSYTEKAGWDSDPVQVHIVRVIDRKNITKYEIRQDPVKDMNPTLKTYPPVEHGRVHWKSNKPFCPFRIIAPVKAEDGIGRSVVRGSAEADITATRILSELIWMIHLTAPLLALWTNRPENEIGDIGCGASRYVVLRAKGGVNDEGEDLKFIQVDTQPLDRLSVQHEKFKAAAREQADRMNLGAITGQGEVSGVSKAWSFKTSEERILFLFGHVMEEIFTDLLKQIASDDGLDVTKVSVKFPETYDIQGPTDTLAQAERFLSICQTFDLPISAGLALKKLTASMLQSIDQDSQDKVAAEIDEKVTNAETIKPEDPLEDGEGPNGKKKTNNGTYRQKADVKYSNTDDKPDDEGEAKEDRSEGDKEDYEGNRKA